jgi:hypothetical protein
MKAFLAKALALVYPPTKVKFRRLLHIGGTAVTLLLGAAVWVVSSNLTTSEKILANVALLIPLLTRWQAIFTALYSVVDKLPIPDGTTVTQTTATTTTTEAVTTLHVPLVGPVPGAVQPTGTPTPVTKPNPTGGQPSNRK